MITIGGITAAGNGEDTPDPGVILSYGNVFDPYDSLDIRASIEVDKNHIVTYGLSVLAKEQLIASKYASEAIKKYKIDPERPMPTKL